MAPSPIKDWLRRKRRGAVILTVLYGIFSLGVGITVLALTFGVLFLFVWVFWLLAFPQAGRVVGVVAATGGTVGVGLICLDSVRARRDDMDLLFLWFLRECVHIGPRALREAFRGVRRVRGLLRLNLEESAEALSFLAMRHRAATKTDLAAKFPAIHWSTLVAQLALFEGVLVLRPDRSALTLTLALQFELRQMLPRTVRVELPKEEESEPEPVPVNEPEKLSPYEVLGVVRDASVLEIRAAYRKRMKECHPDRFANADEATREVAEQWSKAVNAAYETLVTRRVS